MEGWLIVKWILVFGILTAIGAPIAATVFHGFPRRGAAFSLPSMLVPVVVLVFWIGHISFTTTTIALSLLIVTAISGVAYYSGTRPDWPAVAETFGVFLLGFIVFVVFRAANPGITPAGGEQFLHFGVVKSLLRANTLPPSDFWFAGEPLRYYYGTQLQVAVFSVLTDTLPRYGFNLGIAAFYGQLVVTAYGLTGLIVANAGRSYRLGGVLGMFFVAVAGSLTTAVRLFFGLLPDSIALKYGHAAFGAVRHMPYEEAVRELSSPTSWFWFYTRYVIPDTLHEFPLYSFVKADLHGHALSNGYILFAAALAYAYYRTSRDDQWRRAGLLFIGIGSVAGLFGFMNTWALPTAAGLSWLTLATAPAHPASLLPDRITTHLPTTVTNDHETGRDRLVSEGNRILIAGGMAGAVTLVGVVIASPFLVFGHVPTNEGIGLFPPRTHIAPFLVIYSGILSVVAGFLLIQLTPALQEHSIPVSWIVIGFVGLLGVAYLGSLTVVVLTLGIVLATWWLIRTNRIGFEGVLLIAGVGLLLAMELVYAKVWPPTQTRWNTTLKVAVQSWTLMGAAAGAITVLLLSRARENLTLPRTQPTTKVYPSSQLRTVLIVILVIVVLVSSTPFAVLTTAQVVGPELAEDGELTLDGLAVHDTFKSTEMAAIYWLDAQLGTPTIVEAPGDTTYDWTNPASTLTGIPTVIGWDHQQGYRGIDAFTNRANEVDTVYTGSWTEAAQILRKYDVQYIYVGPNERDRYGDDLRPFEGAGVSIVFHNDAVTIYTVNHPTLPA